MREEYVSKDGKVINQEEKDRAYIKRVLIILGSILFVFLFFIIMRSTLQKNTCKGIIKKVESVSLSYAKEENILPVSEGDYVKLELSDLLEKKKIKKEDITVNKEVATGKIKITKYKKEYIVTVELFDCSYCDSSKKKWKKETSKRINKPIVDVTAYYNYRNKSTNFSEWTDWFMNEDLKGNSDKKYKVRLPKEKENLPEIPEDAKIVKVQQEKKEYYRYRDYRCMYYENGGGSYSDFFSSEKPSGYTNFDEDTEKYTEWSNYSLNYPETKPYREIETEKGYKWYYKKGKKKIYYKSGAYAVEVVSDKKYEKDTKTDGTPMYRYRDKQWRWYNGEERNYSSYMEAPSDDYVNKDSELCEYTSFSDWDEESSITNENMSYRKEETDTRYRYRIKYYMVSLPVLNKDITKTELEQKLGQNIDEILKREDIDVSISYKFRVKK